MLNILLAGGALAVLAVLGWVLIHARAQHERLRTRLDLLSNHLGHRHLGGTAPSGPLNRMSGKRAPDFALTEVGGSRLTLAELLAPAKPLLLVFTDARCGACATLLPDIAGWQRVYGDELAIALISAGDAEINHAIAGDYGIRPVLIQPELALVKIYELAQAPAAVVIQPNGLIAAGPRYGAHGIRQLVADTLGPVLPPRPIRDIQVAAT